MSRVLSRVAPYLRELEGQPWIKSAKLLNTPAGGVVELRTPKGARRFRLLLATSNLGRGSIEFYLSKAQRKEASLLFAPYVSAPMASRLVDAKLPFVDRVGNLYLDFPPNYYARNQTGRPRRSESQDLGIRAPGFQALAAILANTSLLNSTVRVLADAADTSRQAAHRIQQLLHDGGFVLTGPRGRVWFPARWDDTLRLWTEGYLRVLRPRLVIGRYRTPYASSTEREQVIETTFTDHAFFFSGAAGAIRLNGYYQSPKTVIHVEESDVHAIVKGMRAVRSVDGPLELLRVPGRAAMVSQSPHVVTPALLYAELLAEENERAREAAEEIRKTYLAMAP